MADLLTNPLLNTGDVSVYTDPSGLVGQQMGDWKTNYNFTIFPFNQFDDNKYIFQSLKVASRSTGGWIPYINQDVNNKYKFYLKQTFIVDNNTSYGEALLHISGRFKIKQLTACYIDIHLSTATTDYYYDIAEETWTEQSTPFYNDFFGSFSDTSPKITDVDYYLSVPQFPANGQVTIIISAPYVVSSVDVKADSFYYDDVVVYSSTSASAAGKTAAFEIDSISFKPLLISPIITGLTTTPDTGTNNGTVTISASSGTPPYQYSTDNITYSSIKIIPDLSFGAYTAYVKDSVGLIVTQPFTINLATIYGKRLTGKVGSKTDVYRVELYEANYTGEAVERDIAAGSLIKGFERGTDFLDTNRVNGSFLDFAIIAEDGDNYDSIVSGSQRHAYVKVWKGINIWWQGWVMPSFFVEDYAGAPYQLQLSARDGLGEFSENTFADLADFGINATGEIQIGTLLSKLLNHISIDSKIYVDNSISAYGTGIWWNQYINISNYVLNEFGLSEFISRLLFTFNMTLRQINGDWFFIRINSYMRSYLSLNKYTTNNVQQGGVLIQHQKVIDGTTANLISKPTIQLQEPFRKVVIKSDFGKKDAAILNPEFKEWDLIGNGVWQLKNWIGNSAGGVYSGEEPDGVTIPIMVSGDEDYLSQVIENVEAGTKMKWTTQVKLLGDLDNVILISALQLEMQIILDDGTTKYYFDGHDGGWDTSPETIILQDFSSESASEGGYKISANLPVSGTIECRIFRSQYISYEVKEFRIEFLNNDGNEYTDIDYIRETINNQNRFTPEEITLYFSDCPIGSNNRLMYSNYFWTGSSVSTLWSDNITGSVKPIAEHFLNTLKMLKTNHYRKLSGSIEIANYEAYNSILVYDKELSRVTVGTTTTIRAQYIGYVLAGGNYDCHNNIFSGEWLERFKSIITTTIEEEEDPVIDPPEIKASLLIDAGKYLMINNENKLLI